MPLQPATTIASGDNVQPEDDSPCIPNYGALAIDATCAPADIAFPQDILLLNLRVKRLKFLLTSCTKKASQRSLGLTEKRQEKNF